MLLLTASLLFCHFLADYSHLTRPWMLKAKMTGSPIAPILAHAIIHATLMYIVMLLIIGNTLPVMYAFYIQVISHTVIDVVKGRLNVFPVIKNPASQWHWIVFGADQLLHQLVILGMVKIVI